MMSLVCTTLKVLKVEQPGARGIFKSFCCTPSKNLETCSGYQLQDAASMLKVEGEAETSIMARFSLVELEMWRVRCLIVLLTRAALALALTMIQLSSM